MQKELRKRELKKFEEDMLFPNIIKDMELIYQDYKEKFCEEASKPRER